MSADGQAIVTEEGYITINDNAEAFTSDGSSGQIAVGGFLLCFPGYGEADRGLQGC